VDQEEEKGAKPEVNSELLKNIKKQINGKIKLKIDKSKIKLNVKPPEPAKNDAGSSLLVKGSSMGSYYENP